MDRDTRAESGDAADAADAGVPCAVPLPASHDTGRTEPAAAGAPVVPATTDSDWDLLFQAVIARLRRIAAEAAVPPDPLHAAVLDCAQALEQVRLALCRERADGAVDRARCAPHGQAFFDRHDAR